jgi:hypothetical protein
MTRCLPLSEVVQHHGTRPFGLVTRPAVHPIESKCDIKASGRGFQHADSLRDHFFTDAVARHDRPRIGDSMLRSFSLLAAALKAMGLPFTPGCRSAHSTCNR